ncbi:hypothetical protein [Sphingomonas suaedae]|nr:hypothetical protein [Sphingomonas suaedae]
MAYRAAERLHDRALGLGLDALCRCKSIHRFDSQHRTGLVGDGGYLELIA